MTAVTAPVVAPRRRSSSGHALHSLLWVHRVQGWWFLAVVVALGVVATVVIAMVTDEMPSVVQFGRQGFTWYPFSMAVIGVAMVLRPHVAVGRTRRGFADGAIVAGVVVAVAYALVLTGLFLVEGVVHDALGWDQRVTEAGWYPFGDGAIAGTFLGQVLLIGAGQMSGLLVSIVYQRAGGWWGTAALPLTAGPVAGVLFLLAWADEGRVEPWVAVVGPLAFAVAAALVFRHLVRGYAVSG